MNKRSELVTVYIPTHCRPEMAIRAVNSVLKQDYPKIEIIVCDDGTPWEHTESLRELLDLNGALYLRNEEPKGACHARNKAIARAKGSLITGLDDDDEFTTTRISELVAAYKPSLAFVAASYTVVSSSGNFARMFDAGYIEYEQLMHYNKVGNQMLTETEKLRAVGGFDESFPAMQDYELWLRLCKCYGTALKLRSPSYILHTEHEENRISNQPKKIQTALTLIKTKYKIDLKRRHIRTHELLDQRLRYGKVPFLKAVGAIHKDNYRMVLEPYVNPAILKIIKKVRFVRHS